MPRIPAALQKMTVAQLKEELTLLGASMRGCKLKKDYQERLVEARKAEKAAPPPSKPSGSPVKPMVTLVEGFSRPFSPIKSPAKSPAKARVNKGSSKKKAGKTSTGGPGFMSAFSVIALIIALAVGVFFFVTSEDAKTGHERVNELFKTAKGSLDELYSLSKGYVVSLELLKKATEELQQVFGAAGGCRPLLTEEMLSSVTFQNDVWGAWSKSVVWSMRDAARGDAPKKGAAILLARNTSYSGSVYEKLRDQSECECVGQFFGANTNSRGDEVSSKSRGQVQKELAEFLSSCGHGIVVVEGLDTFSSDSLSPLHNAMSEQGGLTHDGKMVAGYRATYVLTMNIPMEERFQEDEDLVKQAVKRILVERLGAGEFASAFRRRIDYVGLGREPSSSS